MLVLVLNLLGGHIRGRLDLTRDNLFTLAPGSRDILGNLNDLVQIKLFVSKELPTGDPVGAPGRAGPAFGPA